MLVLYGIGTSTWMYWNTIESCLNFTIGKNTGMNDPIVFMAGYFIILAVIGFIQLSIYANRMCTILNAFAMDGEIKMKRRIRIIRHTANIYRVYLICMVGYDAYVLLHKYGVVEQNDVVFYMVKRAMRGVEVATMVLLLYTQRTSGVEVNQEDGEKQPLMQ